MSCGWPELITLKRSESPRLTQTVRYRLRAMLYNVSMLSLSSTLQSESVNGIAGTCTGYSERILKQDIQAGYSDRIFRQAIREDALKR